SGQGDDMIVEEAKQPIRIIDLFLHTAGFSYGFTDSEVDKRYRATFETLQSPTTDEVIAAIAKLPLNHQPGAQWHYGVNIDVIGFLVERITGKKLGDYMQEVIFRPLKMKDTGFFVQPTNIERFAEVYGPGEKGETVLLDDEPLGDFISDPESHNGGGGLVSTMQDYLIFAQMLLNKGEYKGIRVLGKKTVEYMTTNHLPYDLLPYSPTEPGTGHALGMAVVVDESGLKKMGSVGSYGWGGAASTTFIVDPKENLILIAMTQFIPSSYHPYQEDFNNTVYQALVE
ncbi:MAG: serine hydrolase domain-containing protein, partial [Pseudomonadota bacterium]